MEFPERQSNGSGDGPSNYLKIKDGESVTGILQGELYKYYQVGFGPTAKVVGPGEGKERFRANFVVKEDDKYVAKLWEFGPKIYDMLAALHKSGWKLDNTLLTISRVGSTKENTKYTVSPQKKEPTAATIKAIESIELNTLVREQPRPDAELKNYAPGGDDDGDLPF